MLAGCKQAALVETPDEPEEATPIERAAERDLLEALADNTHEPPAWSLHEWSCIPNWRAECTDPPAHESPDREAQLALRQLLLVYPTYLTNAPIGPKRARRTLEYAELLMIDGKFDMAAQYLRSIVETPTLETGMRVRAGRLMVEALVVLWMQSPPGETRNTTATTLKRVLGQLHGEAGIWQFRSDDAAALRDMAPAILQAAGWDLAMSHRQAGLDSSARTEFAACADELLELFNTFESHPDPALVLAEAAQCASRAYRISDAIAIHKALVDRFPNSAYAADALFALAQTQDGVLYYQDALRSYRQFFERYPADERAAAARAKWVQLAITLDHPVDDIVATWQTGSPDERKLAAAVAFRSALETGEIDDMIHYLDRHRADGGPAREAAARVMLAADFMKRSCPDATRASGLCTLQTTDGRLGEVLARVGLERRRAEKELALARELMRAPTWRDDPIVAAGPPLALPEQELRELEATAALLVGDLSAEEALGVMPPRTYEASRTKVWLDERQISVEAMITAYEIVGRNDVAQAAAAAERTAQVYESDATLLARVALELRDRGKSELAAWLDQIEAERVSQALAAYHQCLAAIAEYGDDPSNVQHACKLGIGRLCGHHDPEIPAIRGSSLRALVLGTN